MTLGFTQWRGGADESICPFQQWAGGLLGQRGAYDDQETMSAKSAIEWTNSTWNPVTGCTKVSPGCKHCYAETFAERWRGIPGHPYEQGFDLRLWPDRLDLPLTWKKPRTIFVNSMSDLFHEKVPLRFIRKVFCTMEKASWHMFQILTKRSERMAELSGEIEWPSNVWMGVSVENTEYLWRARHLRLVPATVRFLSLEPLLGRLGTIDLSGIDWVIVGGESGPGARPMEPEWAREIRDQCLRAGVPFFFKQWGGVRKKKTGRVLDGRTWDGMPKGHPIEASRVRRRAPESEVIADGTT
jgi:protein gp37